MEDLGGGGVMSLCVGIVWVVGWEDDRRFARGPVMSCDEGDLVKVFEIQ